MRTLLFVLLVSSLTMCKSTDKIPQSEITNYVVLLKDGVAIKTLKKDINHDVLDTKRISKSQNQWSIDFKNEGKKAKGIKRDLLNIDYVISVFTKAEFRKVDSQDDKKNSISGKKVMKMR